MSGVKKPFSHYVKDPFPGMSHWFGMLLAIAGLITLLYAAAGRPTHVVAFAIYGTTLILLYFASAITHSLHCSPRFEDTLDRLDYTAIFGLIAGTYTPLCMVTLRGVWGWTLLAVVWTLAVVGICSVWMMREKKNWLRVIMYLAMGWVALVAVVPLLRVFTPAAWGWLIGGGLVYSVGAVVFVTDRPHLWPGRFKAHDLWHTMVLVGSACHFMLMLTFVAAMR